MLAQTKRLIEQNLEEPIQKITSLSGGCSYPSYIVDTNQGKFFAKTSDSPTLNFQFEATGLKQIKTLFSNTPEVIAFSKNILILEYIASEEPKEKFWINLARDLATMHKKEQSTFGFFEDNAIGAASQKNICSNSASKSWAHFFWENRILFKLEELEKDNRQPLEPEKKESLKNAILKKLSSFDSQASLLHGDLWSGNIHCGTNQSAYLIDPAVYFGDREADIAMTECFGGFSPLFYETYDQEFPLQQGYEERKHIYNFYHMLNHLLIFGDGYRTAVQNIASQILSQ